MSSVALAVSVVTIAACSPQTPINTPVQVCMSERDVHRPYRVPGIVSARDLGRYQMRGMQDALPGPEQKTRAIGGDGLSCQPVKSCIFSAGYSVQAPAIGPRGS